MVMAMALNILVTDDCATIRLLIIKTLQLSGMMIDQIYEAENGEEGLKILEENRVDLILMDINMPEMDGVRMLEGVSMVTELRKIPVLIVTAESNIQRVKAVKSTSMEKVAFLLKPFTPECLRNAVITITGADIYGK